MRADAPLVCALSAALPQVGDPVDAVRTALAQLEGQGMTTEAAEARLWAIIAVFEASGQTLH